MIQINKEKHPKLIRLPEVIRKTGFGRACCHNQLNIIDFICIHAYKLMVHLLVQLRLL